MAWCLSEVWIGELEDAQMPITTAVSWEGDIVGVIYFEHLHTVLANLHGEFWEAMSKGEREESIFLCDQIWACPKPKFVLTPK